MTQSEWWRPLRSVQEHGAWAGLRWLVFRRPARWPRWVDVEAAAPPPRRVAPGELAYLLINHSTVLVQVDGWNVLTDPIWSQRCSPVWFAGPRRVHRPGLPFGHLPPIDAVLLSHDHYDHCDMPTLRRLSRRAGVAICAAGNGELLRRAGFERVCELEWWQETKLVPVSELEPSASLQVTSVPAAHFSGRGALLRNRRQWSGFAIRSGERLIYYAGDTGYRESLFRGVRERLGAPHLAFLPIGAYEPRWFMGPVHMDPNEAVRAHLELGAERSVGIHWGTFQLTDEPREEPVTTLAAARGRVGLVGDAFVAGEPGVYLRLGG